MEHYLYPFKKSVKLTEAGLFDLADIQSGFAVFYIQHKVHTADIFVQDLRVQIQAAVLLWETLRIDGLLILRISGLCRHLQAVRKDEAVRTGGQDQLMIVCFQ